jgi:hypothetical protein
MEPYGKKAFVGCPIVRRQIVSEISISLQDRKINHSRKKSIINGYVAASCMDVNPRDNASLIAAEK